MMRGPIVYCLNPDQDKSLQGQDGADLGTIMIDPASLKNSSGGEFVRPGGTACTVRAGNVGFAIGVAGNLSLRLTEFPDVHGRCVYFRLPDLSVAAPDELVNVGNKDP